jgi:hypothetical protein
MLPCRLDVLYGCLGKEYGNFLSKKYFFVNFCQFSLIKALDPDRYSAKMLDPDSDRIRNNFSRYQLSTKLTLFLPEFE